MIKQIINQQIVTYGSLCQHTKYISPRYVHSSKPPPKSKNPEKSDFSLARTRISIFRLIHCNLNNHGNYKPTFLTLTYATNQTNRKICTRDLRLFHMRLNYALNTKLKYIAIPEFQQRGAVHYHIVYFNLPFTPFSHLHNLWSKGNIKIEALQKVSNIPGYISKYITKDSIDSRHAGHRLLITSRSLLRPIVIYNQDVDIYLQLNNTKQVTKFTSDNQIITTYAIQFNSTNISCKT